VWSRRKNSQEHGFERAIVMTEKALYEVCVAVQTQAEQARAARKEFANEM